MFLNTSDVHFHSVEQLLAEQKIFFFVCFLILIEILGAHPSGTILMVVVVDNRVSLVFSF